MIVEKAIEYFAKNGFDGSTRDLAREIGVAQSLVYRYFPKKELLLDQVYEEVYLARWNPLWESDLRNRDVPFEARLKKILPGLCTERAQERLGAYSDFRRV